MSTILNCLNQSFEINFFKEMLAELLRREKAQIKPYPDIDAYMKVRKRYLMKNFV